MTDAAIGLALLRKPFPAHHISKLPKPTKAQTEAVRADFKKGMRCQLCGAWHHPDVVHLDYVGHAALTDRLLDADPAWQWEPLAISSEGLPVLDQCNGMWIRLTVAGVTRLGYGHAGEKTGGDAIKEVIGDALRNAAMRFGAALDLWHKGDLHAEPEPEQGMAAHVLADWLTHIEDSDSVGTLKARVAEAEAACREVNDMAAFAKVQAAAAAKVAKAKSAKVSA